MRQGTGVLLHLSRDRGSNLAAAIGAFLPEIGAFAGLGARFLQPFPKSLVNVRNYSNTKIAVNGR